MWGYGMFVWGGGVWTDPIQPPRQCPRLTGPLLNTPPNKHKTNIKQTTQNNTAGQAAAGAGADEARGGDPGVDPQAAPAEGQRPRAGGEEAVRFGGVLGLGGLC